VVTSRLGVLVGRRRDGTPPWTFPGGKIEPGESPEGIALPVTERLLPVCRRRIRRFNGVTKIAKNPRRFFGHVSHHRGGLATPPPFTADFDVLLPSELRIESALAGQELDEVFQARAEPASAQRKVKRRHVVRGVVPGLRQQVRQRAAVAVKVHVSGRPHRVSRR
jgi:hypothetical protein